MSYVLDPAWHAERARLENICALYDPGTAELCDRLGLAPGWRCLDVGAGTGGVAQRLADRVGPDGEVLAVDADTRFLEPLAGGVLGVRRMDVTAEPLPEGRFDLVHSRLLLEHLTSPEPVLRSMVRAARPGGWVLVEDIDWTTVRAVDPPSPAHDRVVTALLTALAVGPYDQHFGRKVPRLLRAAGLRDVQVRAVSLPLSADPVAGQPAWDLLIEQLAPRLLAAGLVDQDDLDAFHRLWRDGDILGFGPLMVSAWGRRPDTAEV
ncbi:methyltransferase domain-containing protein [Streptomyces catenulae]|uniref:Methyltransferase domain-containing protein n=1 Tax=Streptomyces catenulae TaxID=66875 RepID=A0ABV2Z684_9ACTN|nr:methyltransferase domain-containing protein [Streptomyces catenulae]